ncbi:T9SS type A sorting domain-containing protein, partial [Flavobacterium flavipallidum]
FNVVDGAFTQTFQIGGRENGIQIDKFVFGSGTESFTVKELENFESKRNQTIAFNVLLAKTIGDSDFDPEATASSGLVLSYTSSNTDVATILNGKVHIVGAGSTEITASQSGNEIYNAATSVAQSLTVNKTYYLDTDKDGFGSTTSALFTINVAPEGYATNNSDCNDNDAAVHQPIQYYVDADKDGFGSTATAMLCSSVAPEGYSSNNLDCDDNAILYIDSDGDGLGSGNPVACGVYNNNDCDDTNPIQLVAVISDVYALNPVIDEKNSIYVGYGPTSLSISVTPTGGTGPYTYKWSTNQTAKNITVSAEGIYTVVVTDSKGCQTTASIAIKTINVQCGNSGEKVMICHNGQEICVSSNAVQSHLDHGDKLGSCSYMTSKDSIKVLSEENTSEDVIVYPNPVTTLLNVKVNEVHNGATLILYNPLGMKVLSQTLKSTSEVMNLDRLPTGMYLLNIINGNEITVKQIIKN